ncbi:glycoside hydrolase family 73 protein [Enterococcus sp. BWB1-3]|uniref:glycoside hydrolase family 73 protein n=1 Tax=unclassified Enterococcus TaxID=2608891 RepID=UPI0019206114|nr:MULTISPECIES: glycoside hydrolase family 73 protein [unclassified Enterococcus]MBL1230348.1 glycoside hydrolase family 73 protein [Enterococcus sp. BWB1-3]MCB5955136.1 glycoside hydrolase family 73 protein [Enterococcus sp. CWB-B31]
MKVKRGKKRQFPVILLGLLIVTGIFVFSFRMYFGDDIEKTINTQDNASVSKEEFIDRIRPHAQELQASYGVLPSIIIGQGILESNWGQSTLAAEYNNLFGIKAYGDEEKVNLETKEYINELWVTIQGDFRVYDTWEESMDDHTRLFVNGVTWNPRLYENVLLANNYKEAAQALQSAGYATDPDYADKVIHVIESYELYQYDQ